MYLSIHRPTHPTLYPLTYHLLIHPHIHSFPSIYPPISPPASQQEQLVQTGVIPRLVSIMQQYPENDPLVNVCLLALCNLADMGNLTPPLNPTSRHTHRRRSSSPGVLTERFLSPGVSSPDSAREALAELRVSEVLIFQLRRAPDAERSHIILEILSSLGESGEEGDGGSRLNRVCSNTPDHHGSSTVSHRRAEAPVCRVRGPRGSV